MNFIKSPLVVGYKGEIGSYILNNLLKAFPKASNIWCTDVNDSDKDVIKRIKLSDTIFLCVPLQNTFEWVKKYKKYLRSKVIVEQCSLKSVLFTPENKSIIKGLDFISMHILFRPSSTFDSKDKNYIIYFDEEYCHKIGEYKVIEDIRDIMKDCNIVDLGRKNYIYFHIEHDKIMATQQALVHRVILTLAKCIEDCGTGRTYIGNQIVKLSDRIKTGDLKLYEIIQHNYKFSNQLSEFKSNLNYDKFNIRDYFPKEKKK